MGPINEQLDIRFVSLDSDGPYKLTEKFSPENRELITSYLHEKLGHLSDDIHRCGGYIKVFTQGNCTVGAPQYVDFSGEVWNKIYALELVDNKDDYLDHENYTDI